MRLRPKQPTLFAVVLLLAVCAAMLAQEKARDRRRYLDAGTPVSDDPRRVPVPPGPRGPEGSIVLRGGRLFDGTGTPARNANVVIQRNRIIKIVPADSTDWPRDAQIIDVSGKTVMPGLIDLHTHITYDEPNVPVALSVSESDATLRGIERLRYYLECGITSIRDVASIGEVPFRLKQWVAQNRIPGPRVFAAGQLITGTGGHAAEALGPRSPNYGSIREASGPDDWRQAVREQFKRGADVIKLASHFSRAEVAAAVEEAHALGLKATVDAETFYIQWAVEAGIDSVEHPLPRSDETIRLMAQKGTAAVPTLIPYIYIFDQDGGYFGSTSRRFTFSKEADLEMLRRLKRAGIKLGVGTDLILNWFRYMPDPYITELKHFVMAGYSVPEALVAATKTNSEILDMDDRLGTIEPGKLADVLVLDGKPDVDLNDLAKVDIVMRDGYLVVRGGRLFVPRHIPAPPPTPKKD
jgi:imidazolonepropionase-like amidohydrolase